MRCTSQRLAADLGLGVPVGLSDWVRPGAQAWKQTDVAEERPTFDLPGSCP